MVRVRRLHTLVRQLAAAEQLGEFRMLKASPHHPDALFKAISCGAACKANKRSNTNGSSRRFWGALGVGLAFLPGGLLLTQAACADIEGDPGASLPATRSFLSDAEARVIEKHGRLYGKVPLFQRSEAYMEGGHICVSVHVPANACLKVLTSNIRTKLRHQLYRDSMERHLAEQDTSYSCEWKLSTGARQPPLCVTLLMPVSMEGAGAQILIRKRGAFTAEELNFMESTLELAMRATEAPGIPDLGSSAMQDFEAFSKELENLGFSMIEDLFQNFMKDGEPRWPPPPPSTAPEGAPVHIKRRTARPSPHTAGPSPAPDDAPQRGWGSRHGHEVVQRLQGMGAKVIAPEGPGEGPMDWGVLAGYENQKNAIEDCLLMPLQHPEVYDNIAHKTRKHFSSVRPRAVLFEGPPGTGKTTSARVLSSKAAVPLIYIPLEAVLSKWYGESEQLLSGVFKSANELGGAIIFLDELDSLATSRDRDLHEASRRLLSVLLREIDGFETDKKTVLIGATNRKQDLDRALLNRFDMVITFGLPDDACRAQILQQYAQHLTDEDRVKLAQCTPGMSGRDLKSVCEQTERRWAAKILKKEESEGDLPQVTEYLICAKERQRIIEESTHGNELFNAHMFGRRATSL